MQRFVRGFKKGPELPISSDYDDEFKPKRPRRSTSNMVRRSFLVAGMLIFLGFVIYMVVGGQGNLRNQRNQGSPRSQRSQKSQRAQKNQGYQGYQGDSTLYKAQSEKSSGSSDFPAIQSGLTEMASDSDPMPDTVHYFDMKNYEGSAVDKSNDQRVLLLIPLRNGEKVLPLMFRNMMNMTYNHDLVDVAFLVSDCSKGDKTLETLSKYTKALQQQTLLPLLEKKHKRVVGSGVFGSSDMYEKYLPEDYKERVRKAFSPPYHDQYAKPFHNIEIFQKDFGQVIGQGFSDRHDVKIQGIRRKLMGRARNWLLSAALKPYHSWVYWRDADIETSPGDILQFMMKFAGDFDVVVPNVWRPLPTFLGNEQPYDLNSWIESDAAISLAHSLDEDDVIVEGYAEYPTWRAHLAYIRDPQGNPDEIVDLDGVGGVSILAKAQVFRNGANFPAFTFMNHAETEAFGKMVKRMGFRVGGLPHYTIWHIYEPSQDDLQEISKLERKKRRFGSSK
ncbi:Mannan polymerase I complex van1 subunit [Brettanomyces nanus]|uniref:Mannan polymerase I complex van1 subunit n=1 Tax=Eeniella nana TaxID=13502 RepID=A0A875S097_EENNA|nr:Mannan polymerase I complex van1 subunit [Brettanomyces nanus]QPG73542.1 Mannan polymerase I complex van1 subunit [Brettanomyces nanus]